MESVNRNLHQETNIPILCIQYLCITLMLMNKNYSAFLYTGEATFLTLHVLVVPSLSDAVLRCSILCEVNDVCSACKNAKIDYICHCRA